MRVSATAMGANNDRSEKRGNGLKYTTCVVPSNFPAMVVNMTSMQQYSIQ